MAQCICTARSEVLECLFFCSFWSVVLHTGCPRNVIILARFGHNFKMHIKRATAPSNSMFLIACVCQTELKASVNASLLFFFALHNPFTTLSVSVYDFLFFFIHIHILLLRTKYNAYVSIILFSRIVYILALFNVFSTRHAGALSNKVAYNDSVEVNYFYREYKKITPTTTIAYILS